MQKYYSKDMETLVAMKFNKLIFKKYLYHVQYIAKFIVFYRN